MSEPNWFRSSVVLMLVLIRARVLNLNALLGLNGMNCYDTSAAQCFCPRRYPCECVWWHPANATVAACTVWVFRIRLCSAAAMWRCRQLVNSPTMMTRHLFIPQKSVWKSACAGRVLRCALTAAHDTQKMLKRKLAEMLWKPGMLGEQNGPQSVMANVLIGWKSACAGRVLRCALAAAHDTQRKLKRQSAEMLYKRCGHHLLLNIFSVRRSTCAGDVGGSRPGSRARHPNEAETTVG